jgi:hypothetical protein
VQTVEYIVVKNALGKTRAYLSPETDGVKDCFIDRRINGEGKLEFLLPLQSEKWAEITPECRIIADGREFTILRPDAIDAERSQDGKTWGKVMAEESWALMDKRDVTVSNDPQTPEPADLQVAILSGGVAAGGYPQGSAGSALTYLLQNETEWTLGTVDVEGAHDLETEKLSLLQNIKKVQETWGGLLVWEYVLDEAGNVTQRKVHLRDEAKWQNYNGFEVRYAKNLKSITRTDNNDIVTKLYPFGQDDLDIASVNGGKKYLTNFSYTQAEYVGFYINQEIDDPQVLKEKATEALAKMCKPRFAYRTRLVDLRSLPEFSHEEFTLGDMADVVDPDIGTARVRIQRHKYNVFQPWICELEIGEPEERLAAQLASSFDASRFVKEALRPNPSVSNLLKSFVNTAATTVNGAKGNYTMVDGVSTWWDVDEATGERTGKIVRISPGGVGLSEDGGQAFKQAVTGSGILASAVICSALYALSSGDGFTKLIDDGLHVYDKNGVDRVHVGRWISELAERFGIKIVAADGQTVLLDDRGILQTWQEGKADNVDSYYGLVLNVYVPSETREIRKALLRFKLEAFRAYEKGASADGDHAHLMFRHIGGVWDDSPFYEKTTSAGGHTHTMDSVGSHTHKLYNHQHIDSASGYTSYASSGCEQAGSHAHTINSVSGHYHEYRYPKISLFQARKSSGGEWWNIGLTSPWGYDVDLWTWGASGSHSHGLVFGIYTSTTATGVTIKINGTDRTSALSGPFSSSQNGINIAQYLTTGQWNTIELGSTRLGRIDATIFIQALMGT